MKKVILDIICAICWLICGIIYVIRALAGTPTDNTWMLWACAACEFLCAGLWGVIAYKKHKTYKRFKD